jgi:hypothetical protein
VLTVDGSNQGKNGLKLPVIRTKYRIGVKECKYFRLVGEEAASNQ